MGRKDVKEFWKNFDALEKGRKRPIFTRDRMIVGLPLISMLVLGFIAAWFHVASVLALLFCYASGLLLLTELLSEAGTKVFADKMKLKEKGDISEEDKEYYNLAIDSYLFIVGPIDFWFKKHMTLLPGRAWRSDEEWHMHIYKLRFIAFAFLCLAINFDLFSRIFSYFEGN